MATIHVTLLGRFEVTVDAVPVAASCWTRRHAAALVKVLAMAPGRRLHREQVIDLVWPDDTVEEAMPKLHKAAHFARRAIDVSNAVVLRGDNVALCPDSNTTVDVELFENFARRALINEDVGAARQALSMYGGELLPHDRYAAWAQERREQLRLRYLDLLRLDGRWEGVVELDPSDERAHLALMQRYAANGDRHAALRQFERMARTLQRELGVSPGREATTLRDRLIGEGDVVAPRDDPLLGRDRHHPTLLDRLPDQHREEINRALAGAESSWTGESSHQRLYVAAAELVRRASATSGLLLTIDDVHDADDASLRLLHYIVRSAYDQRICIVFTHRPAPMSATLAQTRQSLLDRHRAVELELGPLGADDVATLIRHHVPQPSPEQVEHIAALSRGIPFAVNELARRAGREPKRTHPMDANVIGGILPATREVLQRVAVVGSSFDTDEFVALSGLPEGTAFDHLDAALAALVIERTSAGYRFRHGLVRDALLDDLPPHRQRQIHRDAASRLIELGASAARIGHHLLQSGAAGDAVPYLLRAAETEAAVGAYRDALALVDAVWPHAIGAHRAAALSLRGDLLNALGDPMATSAYREALDGADPSTVRRLRVRLARCALMSGDVDTAVASLDGLDTDGGADDADILMARGKCAYFTADFATAQAAADEAQRLVLAGERNWMVLDLVSLQGLLAHRSGSWFDRMRLELRRTRDNPEIANAIFDGYLCAAECMLYGSNPYAEVIDLACGLQATARRSGALRAEAFASALIGEAAFLSGDLGLAAAELSEARGLHREIGSAAGEAHSLQRLAEVRIAEGDCELAMQLLQDALPLARGSMLAKHLLQRIFGTMIVAAPDALVARAIIDQAEAMLGWDDFCLFCSIMLSVPASIACARAGDLRNAQRLLGLAQRSAVLWQGTSWEAAIAEAQAAVAAASGDPTTARERMHTAAEKFHGAGQPIDAERCRRATAKC
jgi:DNA-binding SARP family transcriptional activator/predicted negative regulator of RcsB-dependent stress response